MGLLDEKVVLITGGTGSFSRKFVEIVLRDYHPKKRFWVRADIVLRAAAGQTNLFIARRLELSRNTVKHWRYRFAREGIAGIKTRPIPGRPKKASTSSEKDS